MSSIPDLPLETSADNPCFGCGPTNASGLRLKFRRTGSEVRAEFTPSPSHQGWPGRLHTGILYTVLIETANWTLFAVLGRLGIPGRTTTLQTARWVGVNERLESSGRVVSNDDRFATVETKATSSDGALVGSLDRVYELADRETMLKKLGFDSVPAELRNIPPFGSGDSGSRELSLS